MKLLRYPGIELPELFLVENRTDALQCREHGIPYIIRPENWSDENVMKAVLLGMLEKKFPHIDWHKLFGMNICREEIIVHVPSTREDEPVDIGDEGTHMHGTPETTDQADGERLFSGGMADGEIDYAERPLSHILDNTELAANVKIEALQALNVLPVFVSDIADSIKRNLYGRHWNEGYNKKLKVPVGNFESDCQADNLMILDVSNSIPKGVSATMLTLIDTLRTQCQADLIITGSVSKYWKYGETLPDPQVIRNSIGYGNESRQFMSILLNHVLGKKWGNVICFGDHDTPSITKIDAFAAGTEVGKIWAFHTCNDSQLPGYCKWVEACCPETEKEITKEWVRYIRR